MDLEKIKVEIGKLSIEDQALLAAELEKLTLKGSPAVKAQASRRHILDNKQGCCPHCSHLKYVRFGIDRGAQRYKCKSCRRSFTEYTGTWMAGLHKKDKVDAYLTLMLEEKSLDKIKESLKINKKTAFDWRHKILASLTDTDQDDFTGITESDETFFLNSEKGKPPEGRESRKRGGASSKRGVNKDHVAVIVTQDRKSGLDLTVATMGRIKKSDIQKAIGDRINTSQTILCSDAHVSYKGFAKDQNIEHHPLKGIIKQRVKDKIYHIQHVNSTHNRIKKWIDNAFWGVATKYLQQYLNWFKLKEQLKNNKDKALLFVQKTVLDVNAIKNYRNIEAQYQKLISTQL